MRAAVITEYGGPEVLTVVEVPDPSPGPDEIVEPDERGEGNEPE